MTEEKRAMAASPVLLDKIPAAQEVKERGLTNWICKNSVLVNEFVGLVEAAVREMDETGACERCVVYPEAMWRSFRVSPSAPTHELLSREMTRFRDKISKELTDKGYIVENRMANSAGNFRETHMRIALP